MASTQSAPAVVSLSSPQPVWSPGLRFLFRFFFCYWIFAAVLPTPHHVSLLGEIPGARPLLRPYVRLWRAIDPWVAIHVFHLSGKATTWFPTGVSDIALVYVQFFCYIIIALFAATLWSILDRKHPSYQSLYDWLRVLVRYSLACGMLVYGIVKIFPIQFGAINGSLLITPYGQFYPQTVLWSFMGFSRAYTVFAGIIETTGSLFLLFPRTSTLGALISAAALVNVVVLDFSYDVLVRLGAINLLSMAVFLLVPEIRRLANVLLLNNATLPAAVRPLWPARVWTERSVIGLKTLFIAALWISSINWAWKDRERTLPAGPLFGIYDVETFVENGHERLSLATELNRWSRVALMDNGKDGCHITIRNSDDSILEYGCRVRPETTAFQLSNPMVPYSGPPSFTNDSRSVFTYSRPGADHLVLQNSHFMISMRRINRPSLPLSQPFRWTDDGRNR